MVTCGLGVTCAVYVKQLLIGETYMTLDRRLMLLLYLLLRLTKTGDF